MGEITDAQCIHLSIDIEKLLNEVDVHDDVVERTFNLNREDVRLIARKALMQLMEPLAGFVLDSGLSVREMRSIFREAAVRSAFARQLEVARRVNISGIAASTGISRAEISKILKLAANTPRLEGNRQQQSTNRILSAWHHDPKYTTPNGQPADLKIYGRGSTFESLVRNYGRSIPTRALLDELARTGAVEILRSQKIRAKTYVALERGVSPRMIKSFGDRAAELLSTMLKNMRYQDQSQFIASITGTTVSKNSLPLFRKEISSRGSDFLAEIQEGLFRAPERGRKKIDDETSCEVSVTIFYHEVSRKTIFKKHDIAIRQNFRRKI